jgi:hypothetical protein
MASRLSKKPAGKTKKKEATGRRIARKTGESKAGKGAENLYTLKVYIIAGPVPDEYEGKEISRTIQIKGSQTLEDLHYAIFDAFDRWEEHLYEFNLGSGPYDRSKIYAMRMAPDDFDGPEKPAGFVNDTTLDDLKLKTGRVFGYVFDFGDDWQHRIDVEAIERAPARGKFPCVIKRAGKSPPQYAELDEEDK